MDIEKLLRKLYELIADANGVSIKIILITKKGLQNE